MTPHYLDLGIEDTDEVFALTEHGRTLHLVDDFDGDSIDIVRRHVRARCGRRMQRLAHPSDHREGRARVCVLCEKGR